jgi:hypothetical protein
LLIALEQGATLLIDNSREIVELQGNPTVGACAALFSQLLGAESDTGDIEPAGFILADGTVFEFVPELLDAQGGLDAQNKPVNWALLGREHLCSNRFFKLNVYYDGSALIEIVTLDFNDGDDDLVYKKPSEIDWSI